MACKKAEYRAARANDRTRSRRTGYPSENEEHEEEPHKKSHTVEQLRIRRREIAGIETREGIGRESSKYTYTHTHTEKEGKRRGAKIASVGGKGKISPFRPDGTQRTHIDRQILVNSSTLRSGGVLVRATLAGGPI